MLTLESKEGEKWDGAREIFINTIPCKARFEFSLRAISKWESITHRSFFKDIENASDALLLFRCMCLDEITDEELISLLEYGDNTKKMQEYIKDPMSATVIKRQVAKSTNQFVTSELVYYWMVASQIPFEADQWHFNRLMKLIEVCSNENQPKKKMSKSDLNAMYRRTNASRRRKK